MEIIVTGKHLDLGVPLRTYVEQQLSDMVTKYVSQPRSAQVTVSRDGPSFRVDISVHILRGVVVQGHAVHDDAYVSVDKSLERIAKQIRRYKRRLIGQQRRLPEDTTLAQHYVLAPESEDDELPAEAQPAIIAELETEIEVLTVSEAVMRMDLTDAPALLFRNRASGGLNMVYRRSDGNIGWIDPSNVRKSEMAG